MVEMTTDELIEELKKHPGLPVMVYDRREGALTDDFDIGPARYHPKERAGRFGWLWHWEAHHGSDLPEGKPVLVIRP